EAKPIGSAEVDGFRCRSTHPTGCGVGIRLGKSPELGALRRHACAASGRRHARGIGRMATQDVPEGRRLAAFDRSERNGSIGLVLLVAIALVGAALGFVFVGRANAQPYVLALLSILSVVGVFSLFAGAAGILRLSGKETGNAVVKAAAD